MLKMTLISSGKDLCLIPWGNVLLEGKLQIDAKNSNFEIFESTFYMKSVSMPWMEPNESTACSCFPLFKGKRNCHSAKLRPVCVVWIISSEKCNCFLFGNQILKCHPFEK